MKPTAACDPSQVLLAEREKPHPEKLHLKAVLPNELSVPPRSRCWLEVPGRGMVPVEILTDFGSTVLCNQLELHQAHRYRRLVIHKEFLRDRPTISYSPGL
jgi:hypothetical protein